MDQITQSRINFHRKKRNTSNTYNKQAKQTTKMNVQEARNLKFLSNVLLHDVVRSSHIKCKGKREEKCTVKQLEYIVKP